MNMFNNEDCDEWVWPYDCCSKSALRQPSVACARELMLVPRYYCQEEGGCRGTDQRGPLHPSIGLSTPCELHLQLVADLWDGPQSDTHDPRLADPESADIDCERFDQNTPRFADGLTYQGAGLQVAFVEPLSRSS